MKDIKNKILRQCKNLTEEELKIVIKRLKGKFEREYK